MFEKLRLFLIIPHVVLTISLKKIKDNKKHSENADTSTSLTLSCDLDLKSRLNRHMSFDVAYCIVPWYQV